jgi:hypothetical protein
MTISKEEPANALKPFAPEPSLSLGIFGSNWIGRWVWSFIPRIQLVGAGVSMAWYIVMIHRLAKSRGKRRVHMDYQMSAIGTIFKMWIAVDGAHLTPYTAAGFALVLTSLWYCFQLRQ